MALEVTAFIGTNSRNTWRKVKPCREVYFNAVICLGLRELIQEIYWAASADQGHLELNGFEWPDLSGPLATLEIVLPWCDKTSEHRALKLQGGEGALLIWTGKYKCPTQTGQVNRATGNYIHFPQLTSPHTQRIAEFKKWENLINQFQEKFTHFLKKEAHCQCLSLPLKCTLRGQAWIASICPAGMVHTFVKTQEVQTKFDQQNVNMHGILKMNLQSLKQS